MRHGLSKIWNGLVVPKTGMPKSIATSFQRIITRAKQKLALASFFDNTIHKQRDKRIREVLWDTFTTTLSKLLGARRS
jgi:hypothetical protein